MILDGNILSIAGKRERERNDNKQATNASNVTMRRLCFTVPESTMREKVTADYRNGILTVHLPKDPAGQIGSVKIDFPL